MAKIAHVVFGLSSKGQLEASFAHASHLKGEVFSLADDLRVGPIAGLDTGEGNYERKKWFGAIGDEDINLYYDLQGSKDSKTIELIKQQLLKGHLIHIWYGDNSFDLLSLGKLFETIQGFSNQLILVPLSQHIQVISSNWEFVPKRLYELNKAQIPNLQQYFRPISELDVDRFRKIWSTAILRSETLRMVNCDSVFQDNVLEKANNVLISYCTKEYQKAAWVIGNSFVSLEIEVADNTLNWLLKTLVITGNLEATGTLGAIREYEVRLL